MTDPVGMFSITSYGAIGNGTADKTIADNILFEDFYINHANGSGIGLLQGGHQMFNRFFSSACGTGKYGVYIQGNRSTKDSAAGVGAYMVCFRLPILVRDRL